MLSDNDLTIILSRLQNENTKLYDEYGLIDEVLDLQTVINKLRNRFNIPDETQLTESNKGFVQ